MIMVLWLYLHIGSGNRLLLSAKLSRGCIGSCRAIAFRRRQHYFEDSTGLVVLHMTSGSHHSVQIKVKVLMF